MSNPSYKLKDKTLYIMKIIFLIISLITFSYCSSSLMHENTEPNKLDLTSLDDVCSTTDPFLLEKDSNKQLKKLKEKNEQLYNIIRKENNNLFSSSQDLETIYSVKIKINELVSLNGLEIFSDLKNLDIEIGHERVFQSEEDLIDIKYLNSLKTLESLRLHSPKLVYTNSVFLRNLVPSEMIRLKKLQIENIWFNLNWSFSDFINLKEVDANIFYNYSDIKLNSTLMNLLFTPELKGIIRVSFNITDSKLKNYHIKKFKIKYIDRLIDETERNGVSIVTDQQELDQWIEQNTSKNTSFSHINEIKSKNKGLFTFLRDYYPTLISNESIENCKEISYTKGTNPWLSYDIRLDGLELFKNLECLTLKGAHGKIKDFSPLVHLENLNQVWFKETPIEYRQSKLFIKNLQRRRKETSRKGRLKFAKDFSGDIQNFKTDSKTVFSKMRKRL